MSLSATIGALRVTLGANTAAFENGMKSAEARMRSVNKSFGKLSKSISRSGRSLTLGLTAPLGLAGGAFIKAASDAEEMTSKFNVVFGQSADEVARWAERLGDRVGRATQDIQAMASGVQDSFVPLGFARSEATELSKSLTTLAIDVASFNNAQDADVMRNFTSALVGNHEAVRSYGILITEATLKAQLQKMGMADLTGEALEQAKVLARLQLIYAGTTDAQGDAARTSGSFANQMKAFRAQVTELSVELGKILIPAATKLVSTLSEGLNFFKRLNPGIQKTIVVVGGLAAAVGPVLVVLGAMAAAVATLGVPIAALVVAIGGLATAFVLFKDEIVGVFNKVGEYLYDHFYNPIQKVIAGVAKGILKLASTTIKIHEAFAKLFGQNSVSVFLGDMREQLEELSKADLLIFDGIAQKASDAGRAIRDKLTLAIMDLRVEAKNTDAVLQGGFTIPEISLSGAKEAIPDIKVEANTYGPLLDATAQATETMRDKFEDLGRSIGDSVGAGVARGESFFSSLKSTVQNTIQQMIQSVISSGIQKIFSSVFGMFLGGGGGFGAIGSVFGGFFAKGGMPPSNRISVVGEDRPELFVPPGMGGRIIPGDQLGPSGGVTVNIDARGAQDGLLERLRQVMQTEVAAITRGTVDMRLASLSKTAG